jgi:hypothetical protein
MAVKQFQTTKPGQGGGAPGPNTAGGRYENLTNQRETFLKRAQESAEMTIPALMPPNSTGGNVVLYKPFQSIGARGVNNLAAKLLLALLPPGAPFFRLKPSAFDIEEFISAGLAGQEIVDARGALEKGLGKVERAVTDEFEVIGLRTVLFETLKQLLVAGNALLFVRPNSKGVRLFKLDEFVIVRDNEGNPLEMIVKEELSHRTLPPAVQAMLKGTADEAVKEGESDERSIALYTRIVRRKNRWVSYQEVEGREIVNEKGEKITRGSFPLNKSPWIPLRYTRIDKESYGRGFVDEYIGDLTSLESLSQSLVEYGAAASKILPMVDPHGTTDPNDLMKPSGTVIPGKEDDIGFMRVEKLADMRFVSEQADKISRRLEMAFMLNASVQRDAERVTAEEIRLIAQELEDSLGGVYSILSQELQLPLVKRVMLQMQAQQKLPKIDERDARPEIVTGLEALGRNRDLARLEQLVAGVSELFGPQEVAAWIKVGPFITRRATALGIDIEGVVRSEEEVNANKQAQQQQALLEKIGPNATNQIGEAAREQGAAPQGGAQ